MEVQRKSHQIIGRIVSPYGSSAKASMSSKTQVAHPDASLACIARRCTSTAASLRAQPIY